jgi:Ca2+-dependent lipid-binding protein
LELKPVGTLEVKLVQAKDLTNKDLIGKSDPFAIVYVRPLPDKMKRSKTIVSTVSCCELIRLELILNALITYFTEQRS